MEIFLSIMKMVLFCAKLLVQKIDIFIHLMGCGRLRPICKFLNMLKISFLAIMRLCQ